MKISLVILLTVSSILAQVNITGIGGILIYEPSNRRRELRLANLH
jgi:hypothetical protein